MRPGLTGEELVDGLFVDHELARALLDEHAGDGALATPGSVIIVADHGLALKIECFRLLRGVRVLGPGVALQLLQHGVAQGPLGSMPFTAFCNARPGKRCCIFENDVVRTPPGYPL